MFAFCIFVELMTSESNLIDFLLSFIPILRGSEYSSFEYNYSIERICKNKIGFALMMISVIISFCLSVHSVWFVKQRLFRKLSVRPIPECILASPWSNASFLEKQSELFSVFL